MSALTFGLRGPRDRAGLKGPRAADWLAAQGIAPPIAPNTWSHAGTGHGNGHGNGDGALLVARLGAAEFFLEDSPTGTALARLRPALDGCPPGVYPVLREDWAFLISGDTVHEALAQVCNVNFARLPMESHPVIMTLMIGVAVLVVPETAASQRRYRIWCDPSFGPYLGEAIGQVVSECGGEYTGVSA